MTVPATAVAISAAVFGACIGSFLNVCIYRMPKEELSVGSPRRSFCPRCSAPIRWWDNLPVISWLLLAARCRNCREPISARYPAVEALTGTLFGLVVLELWVPVPRAADLLALATWMALFAVLIVISGVDIDHRIIPDSLSVTTAALIPFAAWTLPGMPIDRELPGFVNDFLSRLDRDLAGSAPPLALLLGAGAMVGGFGAGLAFRRWSPTWDGRLRTLWECRLAFALGAAGGILLAGLLGAPRWLARPDSQALASSLLGSAIGAGSIYGIGVLGKVVFRKEAMGFGDVKLMALIGGALGGPSVLIAIFIACVLGSIVGIAVKVATRSSYIPFGPFLAAGAVILILWGDWVADGLDWYQGLFRPG